MVKHHFLSAMKLLVFCSVLIIYFASPTAALKCYQCDDFRDDGPICNNPRVMTCGAEMSQTYCGKAIEVGIEERFKNCNGTCISKSCMGLNREYWCEGPTNYVMHDKVGTSATIFCCQGDLCNGSDKLSNQMNVLLCAVVFSCFHGIVVYLWN